MITNTQSYSEIPLFISADEEGGNVGRLMYKLGTTWVNDMYSYKDMGEDTAYANAYTIGSDMVSCLFNTDFAPVADVWTNPENTVIGAARTPITSPRPPSLSPLPCAASPTRAWSAA